MMKDWQYSCDACKATFDVDRHLWQCPECSGVLDLHYGKEGGLAWQVDPGKPGLWRYHHMLPVSINAKHDAADADKTMSDSPRSALTEQPSSNPNIWRTLGEGLTPLHDFVFCGQDISIKHDYLCPTGSYKDRGAAVMVHNAVRLGIKEAVEDSSGNAGCAVAAFCALNQITCTIYLPESTSPGKIKQVAAYGANIMKIPGSRQETSLAIRKAAQQQAYLSHIYDPYFYQGTKTVAYEVYEQTNGQLPDQLIVPVGHGTMFLGLYLGLSHLKDAGKIDKLPRLIAVQAENCAPLYKAAVETGVDTISSGNRQISQMSGPLSVKQTVAEGIAISEPPRLSQMLTAVKASSGAVMTVSEDEISQALDQAYKHGLYIEPTSAVVFAALKHTQKNNETNLKTMCLLSGHGLKASIY